MAGNELATAYITLVPSLKGAQASIERQLNGVDTTTAGKQMGDKASSGFGSGFNIKGAAVAAAAVAGAAAAATLVGTISSSINEYANYEQLVGGVDTLFKESSDKLQQYASNAYKTAGVSANEYMEQATSFSASLIQSLGGDTAMAVEYANMAITDMSDNANKMGTDMMMIQNAYQGFAKQNFTMLDNLKLGYGGTQEEMQRLLADATALSGIEYDMSSYADIVDAIHVIQTEMGITGTTALEASETISGSVASMQAKWSDWLVSLATGNGDVAVQTQELMDTIATMAGNMVPRIGEIVTTLGTLLMEQLPVIMDSLVSYVSAHAVDMAAAAIEFFMTLVTAMVKATPEILAALGLALAGVVVAIGNKVGEVFDKGVELARGVFNGIKSWVGKITQAGRDLIAGMVSGITSAGGAVWEAIKRICSNALGAIKSFFGIASPSKVMREMFGYVGDGMALGLSDSEDTVNGAMKSLVSGASDVAAGFAPSVAVAASGAYSGSAYGPIDYMALGEAVARALEGANITAKTYLGDRFVSEMDRAFGNSQLMAARGVAL